MELPRKTMCFLYYHRIQQYDNKNMSTNMNKKNRKVDFDDEPQFIDVSEGSSGNKRRAGVNSERSSHTGMAKASTTIVPRYVNPNVGYYKRIKDKTHELKIKQKRDVKHASLATIDAYDNYDYDSFNSDHSSHIVTPQMFSLMNGTLKLDVSDDVTDSIDGITQALNNVSATGIGLSSETRELLANVSNKLSAPILTHNFNFFDFEALRKNLPEVLVLGLVVFIVLTFKPTSVMEQGALYAIAAAFVATYYSASLPFWSQNTSSVSPQVGLDMPATIDMVTTILNLYTTAHLPGMTFSAEQVMRLGERLSKVNNGFKPIISSLCTILVFIHSTFEAWLTNDKDGLFLITGIDYIDEWSKEVHVELEKYDAGKLYANGSNVARMSKLFKKGEELVVRLNHPSHVSVRYVVYRLIDRVKKVLDLLKSTNYTFAGVRQEPVGILLRGPPGCGKSNAMQHIANLIAMNTFSEEDRKAYLENPANFIYNRQSEGVYWDGYSTTHKIVLYDDLGQARDVAGQPDNEYMNVIRNINSFENNLHCAAIDLKGNTMFRAEFVIGNTNINSIAIESIQEPAAFWRRWDIIVDVSPKVEYCVEPDLNRWARKMDDSKLPTIDIDGEPVTKRSVHHLDFTFMKFIDGKVIESGEIGDFNTFMRRILSVYKKKKAWHELYKHQLKESISPQVGGDLSEIELTSPWGRCVIPEKLHNEIANNIGTTEMENFIWTVTLARDILNKRIDPYVATPEDIFTIAMKPDHKSIALRNDHSLLADSVFREILDIVKMRGVNPEHNTFMKKIRENMEDFLSTLDRNVIGKVKGVYEQLTSSFSMFPISDRVEALRSFGGDLYNKYCNSYMYNITINAGRAGAILAVVYKISQWVMTPKDVLALQSAPNNVKIKRGRAKVVTPQSVFESSPAVKSFVYDRVGKNVFEIFGPSLENISLTKFYGTCLSPKGYTIICPYHFMSHIQEVYFQQGKSKIVRFVKYGSSNVYFDFTVEEVLSFWIDDEMLMDREIAVLKMPRTFRPSRDITSCFWDSISLDRNRSYNSMLALMRSKPITTLEWHGIVAKRKPDVLRIDNPAWENYTIVDVWEYSAPTSGGDCGSLIVTNTSKDTKIIGMHVAGVSNGLAYGLVLTSDLVFKALEIAMETYEVNGVDEPVINLEMGDLPNMELIGTINGPSPSSNGKSSLFHSPLYGKWSVPLRKPARLRPFEANGNRIDPMAIAQLAYCRGDVFISKELLDLATVSVENMLYTNSLPASTKRVFSFDEAVLGDDSGILGSIPRSTSAGFPYTIMKGTKTKARFFGVGEKYDLTTMECQELIVKVNAIISDARKGVRNCHYFTDSLKDELRKIDKVNNGLTRMFSACPTPLLIVVRMYFGAFQRWILENYIKNGIAVGVNEYGMDWDIVARKLLVFGDNAIGAGDYKSFDMSQLSRVQWCILDIINRWYDDDNNDIRSLLWLEVVNSFHIVNGRVTCWSSSLSSGFALTWLVNAFYNHMAFRLCWYSSYVDDFNKHVSLIVCGDDHVYSVSPQYRKLFHERFVQEHMELFGLKYTPEDKDKSLCDSSLRSISEVTFLKRRFLFDEVLRRYVAPLELNVILEIPYWCRNTSSVCNDTQNNLQTAVEELSLHDYDTFRFWSAKMLLAASDIEGLYPEFGTYKQLRNKVLTRGVHSSELYLITVDHADLVSTLGSLSFNFLDDSILVEDVFVTPQIGDLLGECYVFGDANLISIGEIDVDTRLRASGNEFLNGKLASTLVSIRCRSIQSYCQEGMVAVLPNSRSSDERLILVQMGGDNCTTDSKHDSTTGLPEGQQNSGAFVPVRNDDTTPSFPSNSTTGATIDAEVTKARVARFKAVTMKDIDSPMTGVTQEIRDFLTKPLLVSNGSFATTDSVPTSIWSATVPAAQMANSLWYNKISGNMAFRAKMVWTLQVMRIGFNKEGIYWHIYLLLVVIT